MIEDLVTNALVYGMTVKGAAYSLYLFGRYAEGDWVAIAVFTAAVAVLFALLWYVLSRSFLGIVTSTGKTARREYKEKTVQRQSVSAPCWARSWGDSPPAPTTCSTAAWASSCSRWAASPCW